MIAYEYSINMYSINVYSINMYTTFQWLLLLLIDDCQYTQTLFYSPLQWTGFLGIFL